MQRNSKEPLGVQIALYLITTAVVVLCLIILHPFLISIVGAIVLAVATHRPYRWLVARIPNRTASATLALFLVILSLVIPTALLTRTLVKQAVTLVHTLRSNETQDRIIETLGRHPSLADKVDILSDGIDVKRITQTTTAFVGARLAGWLRNSVAVITRVVIMLVILFFLYRDEELATTFAASILPLNPHETDELFLRIRDTIYATALGRLAIALIQGTLAGLAFWLLGVPNPLLWAILTVFLSMIPAFGSFLVWGPIAIYLGVNGHWGKAAILAVWGGVIVSTIDNILYPILVGAQIRQHTVTILLSILGGIAVFGVSGIILGPVTFTTAAALIEIARERNLPDPQRITEQ